MTVSTYSYKESLAAVEKVIKSTGIRKFCSSVCKGSCCKPCKTGCSSDSRKLICSSYICSPLSRIFLHAEEQGVAYISPLLTVKTISHNFIVEILDKNKNTKFVSPYFNKIDKKYTNKVKIPKFIIDSLSFVYIPDGWQNILRFNDGYIESKIEDIINWITICRKQQK